MGKRRKTAKKKPTFLEITKKMQEIFKKAIEEGRITEADIQRAEEAIKR